MSKAVEAPPSPGQFDIGKTQDSASVIKDMKTQDSAHEELSRMKGNSMYVFMFALFQTFVGFQLGYIFCYTNQMAPALDAKFGWEGNKATINESVIGSSATLTLMLSAALTGRWIKNGRRKWLIYSAFIGMLGTGITMIQNYPAIIFGRLLYGFAVGIIAIAMPRYMEETVPLSLTGFYGGLYCLSFAIATIIGYFLAVILPPDTDK